MIFQYLATATAEAAVRVTTTAMAEAAITETTTVGTAVTTMAADEAETTMVDGVAMVTAAPVMPTVISISIF